MIRRTLALWTVLCAALVFWAGLAFAQTETGSDPAPEAGAVAPDEGPAEAPDEAPVQIVLEGVDYPVWDELARRAEIAVEAGRASDIIFEGLRADLAGWRETFLAAQSANATRIATIDSQLAALGAAPEEEGAEEEPGVAQRRAELSAERARLSAPNILAAEGFARADGLIGEIDAILRDRQAVALLERGQSPLLPAVWIDTWEATTRGWRLVSGETVQAYQTASTRARLNQSLTPALLLSVLALVALLRGRVWIARLEHAVAGQAGKGGRRVAAFLVSLGQIVIPYLGLLALSEALTSTSLFGFRGTTIVDAIPQAGLAVVVARWVAGQYFPPGEIEGPGLFARALDRRSEARALVVGLGWVMAIQTLLGAWSSAIGATSDVSSALVFGAHLLAGYGLFRLGRLMRKVAADVGEEEEGAVLYRLQLLSLVGRLVQIVAIAGPLAAALGLNTLAEAILYPTIMTIAVLGVVQILQRLVNDLFAMLAGENRGAADTLAPVLIAFALLIAAIPALALIWGVRSTELLELWTSFREGFLIGETRISPTDFLTFAAVFTALYVATRLLQGALRNTILPRTRLDTGGQVAVVSGVGYVGVFLAAIVAITTAGIDLSGLAIVAGALSVGIGFGLQTIVSNFVSGIILLIERPISEGDWIEVGGQMGYVRNISVRSTRIETFDRTDVIVPNADLVSGTVTNYTRGNSVGRAIVPVGVAYGTDTRRVAEVLQEIAEAHPMVLLKPPPSVVFAGFGADSLDFEIRAILRDVNWLLSVKTEMNHEIARRFEEEGFEIPFAQRDIWLRNPEALRPGDEMPRAADADQEAVPAPQVADHGTAEDLDEGAPQTEAEDGGAGEDGTT